MFSSMNRALAKRRRRGVDDDHDVQHLIGKEAVEPCDATRLSNEFNKPDLQRLLGELDQLQSAHDFELRTGYGDRKYTSVYRNTRGWSTVGIRTLHGWKGAKGNQLRTLKPGMKFKWTEAAQTMPYLMSYLNGLNTKLYLIRIMKLKAGGVIATHRDGKAFRDRQVMLRCHIPLVTHPDVEFVVAGKSYHLEAGHLWFTRVDKTHAVYNHSNVDRVHIVIDMAPPDAFREMVGLPIHIPRPTTEGVIQKRRTKPHMFRMSASRYTWI